MDCTSVFRMFHPSTIINCNNNSNGNGVGDSAQLQKRVKNIRLTHGQFKQQSHCKTRLVLLLLGLWMNLIAVTNGKWKIQLVKHMFFSIFFGLLLKLFRPFNFDSSSNLSFHLIFTLISSNFILSIHTQIMCVFDNNT